MNKGFSSVRGNLRLVAALLAMVLIIPVLPMAVGRPAVAQAAGWYSQAWGFRKKIVLDHTKVVGGFSLDNIPVLIQEVSDSDLSAHAKSTGQDILFTDSDGVTKLDHELESFDPATGKITAWVRVPVLSSSVDTVIYLYFGNSASSSQQNPSGVWQSGYDGVWHLPDGTNLSAKDSSANGNNAASLGNAAAGPGLLNGGARFGSEGSAAISVPDSPSLAASGSNLTVSAWLSPASDAQNAYAYVVSKTVSGNQAPYSMYGLFRPLNTDMMNFSISGNTPNSSASAIGGTMTAGSWNYVVGTYDGSVISLYVNGILAATSSAPGLTVGSTGQPLYFGNDGQVNSNGFLGGLDEVRVSNVVRSAGWIATEYNEQSDPLAFYTVGASESAPVVDATPPVVAITNPVEGQTVSGTVAITATSTDDTGVASVRFFVDGLQQGNEVTSAPYQISLDTTTLANSTHTAMALAQDLAGNSATSSTVSFVVDNSTTTPPALPVITSFSASPGTIISGSSTVLSWTVSGASSINIDNDVGNVSGLTSRAVSPTSTTTYVLTASNDTGTATSTATVTVNSPPVSNIIYVNGYPTINGQYVDCSGNIDNDQAHHTLNAEDNDPAHHSGQNCPPGSFVAGGGGNLPPGIPAFTVSTSMPGTVFAPGSMSAVTTKVTSNVNLNDVIVDTEIYNGAQNKVAQNFLTANLTAGQEFSTPWALNLPGVSGPYYVRVGVFNTSWSGLYRWVNDAFTFNISSSAPTSSQLVILQPTDNSQVSGVVQVQAVIPGRSLDSYSVGWRVDPNGLFVDMPNDTLNAFKSNWIDFSNWNWSSNHVYTLQFRAVDTGNQVIGTATVIVNH